MSEIERKMRTRAEIEADLQYHLKERDKASAAIEASILARAPRHPSSEYENAQFQRTWHTGAASALALVLGFAGVNELDMRKTGTWDINPEDHEQ